MLNTKRPACRMFSVIDNSINVCVCENWVRFTYFSSALSSLHVINSLALLVTEEQTVLEGFENT